MLAMSQHLPTVTTMTAQPRQLKIAFAAATQPTRVSVDVNGLTVFVSSDIANHELLSFLREAGLAPSYDDVTGVTVAASALPELVNCVAHVGSPENVRPLLTALLHRPPVDAPAMLSVENNQLLLTWDDGVTGFAEYVPDSIAPAFVASDISFVATDDAWDRLEAVSRAPSIVARCALNAAGFIEIQALRPQMVEHAAVPGLFALDQTTFAASVHAAPQVAALPGFVWTSHRPPPRPTPAMRRPSHRAFAEHILADLPAFLVDLDMSGSRVVRWDAGLGRRLFALAALDALDAFPTCVLAAPSSVWVWRRYAALVGRTLALTHDNAELSLVTYHDAQHRNFDAQAIVFDDPTGDEARRALPHLARLGHLRDVHRIALCATDAWPDDPVEQVELMEVLRPTEFDSKVAIAQRYPLDAQRRLAEHVEAYVDARSWSHTGPIAAFKRSTTKSVHLTEDQQQALLAAGPRLDSLDPSEALAEILEVVSAGPSHAMSPKIGVALTAIRDAHSAGRSIAVCTRHQRATALLRALARPLEVDVVSSGAVRSPVSVVRFDTALPDLSGFDEVWFLDYPWSLAELDASVGAAGFPHGPDVTVIHAPGTIDDRLALLAARRAEAPLGNAIHPPSHDEIGYLLARR